LQSRITKASVALVLIVVLGAILRLYHLQTVPSEVIVDEIDLYNSAHSIVTMGHDVDGRLVPFLYARFTRNPPLYAVAGFASSVVFGKTPLGLRLPAVIFGLTAVLLIYAIAFELTRRRDIALLAALLQAIAPIFIQFSRIAWEPASELPFLLGGIYVLLLALRRNAPTLLGWGALLLALTSYTYLAGWFYALLLGAPLFVIYIAAYRSWRAVSAVYAAAALWFLASMPAVWMLFFDPQTSARIARLAIFANGVTPAAIKAFALNYAAQLRWSYLAVNGDPHAGLTWRYLNGFGAFYWWLIPLALLGVLCTFKYVRGRALAAWVWFWLLVYPLGGALTNEGVANAPRTLAGAPVVCLLAAMGLMLLLDAAGSIKWRVVARPARFVVAAAFTVVATISVVQFSWFYFTKFVHQNSNAWDSGTRAMFERIIAESSHYERVCFSVLPQWYDADSYSRFYLSGSRLQWLDGIRDPRCSLPGTMIAVDAADPITRPGFADIATIDDVDGSRFAYITGRARGEGSLGLGAGFTFLH
jgi:4-amino-4-deoxy-L-arabinose transferase-like glycosyltransferase